MLFEPVVDGIPEVVRCFDNNFAAHILRESLCKLIVPVAVVTKRSYTNY